MTGSVCGIDSFGALISLSPRFLCGMAQRVTAHATLIALSVKPLQMEQPRVQAGLQDTIAL
jgi:hypothetical protein